MKCIEMLAPRKSNVIEVEIPTINERQLLVKVTYTGICHSEYYPWLTAKKGARFGHEAVGVVEEVGALVTGFKKGDRVTGLGGGGYKQYIVMDEKKVCLVPVVLADEDAIVEPLACIMSACIKMKPTDENDTIAVVGCGYMGLGSIALLKAYGYKKIVAVDKRKEALFNAVKFGATEVYTPSELPLVYKLNWQTMGTPNLTRDGYSVDIFSLGFSNVLEFTGTADGLELAAEMVCAHGRLGIGGYHNDSPRTLDFKLLNYKAISMINCH
jgi:threonine dehydrogenase-like Zn-dependent dehydrogenase